MHDRDAINTSEIFANSLVHVLIGVGFVVVVILNVVG